MSFLDSLKNIGSTLMAKAPEYLDTAISNSLNKTRETNRVTPSLVKKEKIKKAKGGFLSKYKMPLLLALAGIAAFMLLKRRRT